MSHHHSAIRILGAFLMTLVASALMACGDSEVFLAYEGDVQPVSDRSMVDAKADDARSGRRQVSPAQGGEAFPVSSATLDFDGEGLDALIILEGSSSIGASFGEGAATTRHTVDHSGILMTWDGEPSDVFVRPVGSGHDWAKLVMDPSDGISHRGAVWFERSHSLFEIYIESPDALDILIIEPIANN